MYFRYFVIISPWKRAGPSSAQTWIPFTQGCLLSNLVEIGSVVLENKFFLISSMYFLLFWNYLPLEKGRALHLNKLESPLLKDALCQVWLKLAQWFWRSRWKYEKFTDGRTDEHTDGQTDRSTEYGRQVIRKAHLSFQLRWAKNRRQSCWKGRRKKELHVCQVFMFTFSSSTHPPPSPLRKPAQNG